MPGAVRLTYRLLIAFVMIAAVAVGVAALLVGLRTNEAFRRFSDDRVLRDLTVVADDIAGGYALAGGFEQLAPHYVIGRGRGFDIVIVDAVGTIRHPVDLAGDVAAGVAGTDAPFVSIMVNGAQVGRVIAVRRTVGPGGSPGFRRVFGSDGSPLNLEQRFVDETTRSLWIAFGVAIGVAVLLAVFVSRGISRPLARLSEVARRVARGERDVRSQIRGSGEIGELSRTFDSMADSLDRQERARRSLFADIAHELRTPLTVIEGNAQAMLDGVYERSDADLQAIVDRTRGLTRLVDDVRDLSLAEVGRLSLETSDLALAPLVADVVRGMDRLAEAKGVSLRAEIADAGTARADGMRLRQVLGNLINNAIRHTPNGGTVTVTAQPTSQAMVAITVADSGQGIAPDDLPHVFDRFYRADSSRARTSGGSGLGLAIVRALVSAMGGTVAVDSRPGEGATFRLALPAASIEPDAVSR